jgi:L-arabinose transport system ATP-binding protein
VTAPVLAVEGVEKRFGVVRALADVSLAVAAGEILGLVGENGAGKSTLMRIVEGVFAPDAGTVRVDGRAVRFREPKEAHALGIRVIHQEPEIVPALTVAENVFAGAIPNVGPFVDRRRLAAGTRAVLARFGATEIRPDAPAGTLGPAQRQMVEIMRAVRAGGRIIAFDEPTSSLTDEEARRLFAVVRGLAAEGTAIVYISHRLDEIVALASRVAVLRDGRLVADRPAAGLSEEKIACAMVGRDIADHFRRDAHRPGKPLLEVRGLRTAKVHGVDLTVRAGEVVGIGGLMGAGRSELARGIVGFDRRLGGTVAMAGRPVAPDAPADAIRAGIGLAPEDRKHEALLLARSVLDNAALAVPGKVSAGGFFSRRRAEAVVAPLARRLAVKTPSLDEPVARLSGGNQQKVVLARWLAVEPAVLILDEPTRGIDVGAKAEIYRLIDDLAKAGIGLLVISSEMPELLGLSDRILVMAGGSIAGELTGSDMTEANILALAMPPRIKGAAA